MLVDERRWTALLRAQEGVVSRRQALACGWTQGALQHRLGVTWQRLLPATYLTTTGVPSRSQVMWAAVLHGGACAALTSWTGLEVWGVRVDRRAEIHVAVPDTQRRGGSRALSTGGRVVVHRTTRPLEPLRHLPTLPVERCAVDASLTLSSLTGVRSLLSAVVQQGWSTAQRLGAELDLARGMRTGLARTALDEVAAGARSGAEAALLAALRKQRLPPYVLNGDIRAASGRWLARSDVVIPSARVLVEVDGARWHASTEQWRADIERQTALVAEGWTVLRYTATQVFTDPDSVAAQIAQVSAGRTVA